MIEGIRFDWNNTYACLYYPGQSSKCDVNWFHGQVNINVFCGYKILRILDEFVKFAKYYTLQIQSVVQSVY